MRRSSTQSVAEGADGEVENRPTLFLLLPPALRKEPFAESAMRSLDGACRVIANDKDRNWTTEELSEALEKIEVLVTGWEVRRCNH